MRLSPSSSVAVSAWTRVSFSFMVMVLLEVQTGASLTFLTVILRVCLVSLVPSETLSLIS